MIVLCTVLCCVLSIINTCTMHCICITLQGGASSAWNVSWEQSRFSSNIALYLFCILLYLYLHPICITLRGHHLLGMFPGSPFSSDTALYLYSYFLYLYLHPICITLQWTGSILCLECFLGVTSRLLQYSRGTALPSEPRIFSEDNTCTSAFVQRRCCRNCTFSVSCRVRLQCSSSSCVPDCTRGFPLKLPGTQICRN